MCQIIMTVCMRWKVWLHVFLDFMSNVLCDTVFILCTCILIVVNAILAAVLKQVVLFVLYIDDGQDLGADLIMGIHYPVVHVFSKRHAVI